MSERIPTKMPDERAAALDAAVRVLQDYGSPLVHPVHGAVLVCKRGRCFSAPTLYEALELMREGLAVVDAQRSL